MSISRIPDPKFVYCTECEFRHGRKEMDRMGKGSKTVYYCILNTPWRELFGQKGCSFGQRKSMNTIATQLTEFMDNDSKARM